MSCGNGRRRFTSPHLLLILIGKFQLNTNIEVPFAYHKLRPHNPLAHNLTSAGPHRYLLTFPARFLVEEVFATMYVSPPP